MQETFCGLYFRGKTLFKRGKRWYNGIMCEILAPAGDEVAFFAALDAGADAVYLGMRSFSARANAANFTPERLKELIRRAHLFGVRVYVALNTLVKERELSAFFQSAEEAWNAGADALIVQELFLGKELKRQCPQMVLHLSTQAGVCNAYGARQAKACGFSRVILARETPLAEIAAVCKEIETEVFVQGALCSCFSGQCYLSSFAGGNSGNRGLCKQPCRKRYASDRAGGEPLCYRLSLSDLCVGERAKELAAAGVVSFKIEGRMRSAAYVRAAVRYYKDVFGGAPAQQLASDFSCLKRTYNRGGYTAGYAFGEDASLHSVSVQGHIGEEVGVLSRFCKNDKTAYIASSFSPAEGDGFKLLRGGKEVCGAVWRAAYGKERGGFFLPADPAWRVGDAVCLTLDNALTARLAAQKRLVPLRLSFAMRAGEAPAVTVRAAFGEMTVVGDCAAERAKSSPTGEEEIRRCFAKTDGLPFAAEWERIDAGEGCFLVRSTLNALRRKVYAAAEQAFAGEDRPPVSLGAPQGAVSRFAASEGGEIAVIDEDCRSFAYRCHAVDHFIFKPVNYENEQEIDDFLENAKYYAWHNWLYLPAFATESELKSILRYAPRFYGIYGEGVFSARFCAEHGLRWFAGVGCNLCSGADVAGALEAGAERAALSKELSARELAEAASGGAFVLCGGGVKVMDLVHCPFGRACACCDRRRRYTLTDEAGRVFPLLRYRTSACRFELYNSALLAVRESLLPRGAARLYDLTGLTEAEKECFLAGRGEELPHTGGAFKRGVL